MPFVRIDIIEGRTGAQVAAVGVSVQRALVETMKVPERDREEWSFGNGVAHYVVLPKEEWK